MIINSYSYSVAAAPDVTPDTVAASYPTSNEYGFADAHSNNYFQVQGINQTITLKASIANSPGRLYCKVLNTEPTAELSENPLAGGWTSLANNGTITISDNQYFLFGGYYTSPTFAEFDVEVLNNSDGDNLITTVNCLVDNS